MCRMILAIGKFDFNSIIEAAIEMSRGENYKHNGPVSIHPNGWGMLWKDEFGTLRFKKSSDPIFIDKWFNSQDLGGSMLAIHVRHATEPDKLGEQFSHPRYLNDDIDGSWFMMHNGYMPTIYKYLGYAESIFDSDEYLLSMKSFINSENINGIQLTEFLDSMDTGNSSGNAFFINLNKAIVYQWYPVGTKYKEYFTLNMYRNDKYVVFSSEVITNIAPYDEWVQLERGEVKIELL